MKKNAWGVNIQFHRYVLNRKNKFERKNMEHHKIHIMLQLITIIQSNVFRNSFQSNNDRPKMINWCLSLHWVLSPIRLIRISICTSLIILAHFFLLFSLSILHAMEVFKMQRPIKSVNQFSTIVVSITELSFNIRQRKWRHRKCRSATLWHFMPSAFGHCSLSANAIKYERLLALCDSRVSAFVIVYSFHVDKINSKFTVFTVVSLSAPSTHSRTIFVASARNTKWIHRYLCIVYAFQENNAISLCFCFWF